MNGWKNKKGFTLVEVIVTLLILAVLSAIIVPSAVGWIEKADEKACQLNRSQIIRYYAYVRQLEYKESGEVTLSAVLAGDYEVCAADVAVLLCPTGGTYTADDENGVIACSHHGGGAGGETPGGGEEEPTPSTPENTPGYFYLMGDSRYKVNTWGDLEQFQPAHDGQPGTNIPTGAIFYYQGSYYLFRDNQYLTAGTNLPAYVAGYGVRINNTVFVTPSTSTNPGDVKLVNGRAYVFYPYSRYYQDYLNQSWWYEIVLAS